MNWSYIPKTIWLNNELETTDAVSYLSQNKEGVAFDLETTGVNKIKDYPLLFSLSDGVQRYAGDAELLQISIMKDFLESDIPKIGSYIANADMHWSENVGIKLGGPIYDTIVMDWLYDENREGQHGLKDITWTYLGIKMRDFKEVFPMKRGDTAGDAIIRKMKEDPEDAKEYSGLDAYCNYKCFIYLKEQLEKIPWSNNQTLWDYFLQIEVPYTRLLFNMSRRGIQVDVGYLKQQQYSGKKYIEGIEKDFNNDVEPIMGEKINMKSSQQLKKLFLEKLGKISNKKTPKGEFSVDSEVLKTWSDEGDDLAEKVVSYKKYTKIYDTYIKGIQEEVDNKYRIHTNFNQAGTTTGRLSSNSPNLQNCLTGDTEIWTEKGWVRFDKLEHGIKVYQWRNFKYELVMPEDYIKQKYKGKMITLKSNNIDLILTPDHRCPIVEDLEDDDYGAIEDYSAIDFPSRDWLLHLYGSWREAKNGTINHYFLSERTSWVTKNTIDYDDCVYCVTVPSGYIIVRRNGKISVTGNCPRPGSDPFSIRKAFVASYKHKLIVFDFSQLELIIMAHKSNDANMIEAITNGKDLHLFAVSLVFGYNYDDLFKAKKKEKKEGRASLTDLEKLFLDLRQAMKTAGYLIIYGGGAYKLARQLTLEFRKSDPNAQNKYCEYCEEVFDLDIDMCTNCGPQKTEAEQKMDIWGKLMDKWAIPGKLITVPKMVSVYKAQYYIDSWFKAFPNVKTFINYQHRLVEKQFHVRTFLGRYRRLPEIGSSSNIDKSKARRQAVNIIQGDASDLLKVTQLVIENDPELKQLNCKQLIQVHDELVFECPEESVEQSIKRIKYLMENSFSQYVFSLSVPLTVEGSSSDNWAEAK